LHCLPGPLLAGAALVNYIPQRAEQLFGPPAPGLSLPDRVVLSTRLLIQQNDLLYPTDPAGIERPFPIELGEPAASIIGRLQSDGLITNADAFRFYLQYTGLDTTIQAGDYRLSPAMTPVEIARALQDATPTEVSFHILPGWGLRDRRFTAHFRLNITWMSSGRLRPARRIFLLPSAAAGLYGGSVPGVIAAAHLNTAGPSRC
jgi:hypothetical protein